jgi:putative Mn2+ efflux pump MntP
MTWIGRCRGEGHPVRVRLRRGRIIIGIVTFVASMLGILLGKRTGPRFNQYAEIMGGLILILIGVKILVEHMWA